MVICAVCHKPIRDGGGYLIGASRHHFYHPRKQYTHRRNPIIILHSQCHMDYNDFWYRHCHDDCVLGNTCPFRTVCCYFKA